MIFTMPFRRRLYVVLSAAAVIPLVVVFLLLVARHSPMLATARNAIVGNPGWAVIFVLAWAGFVIAAAEILHRPFAGLFERIRRSAYGGWEKPLEESGFPEILGVAQEFNALRARMDQVSQLKDRLLSTLSHDLRSPLSAISVSARGLLRESLSSDALGLAETIETSATRLRVMVSNALDSARLREGRLVYEKSRFPAGKILTEIQKLFSATAAESGKKFTLDLPDTLPLLKADEEKTHRIFINLLSNAFKFTRRGDAISVQASAEGSWLRFTVSDTGPGISLERRARIFEPFSSVEFGPAQQGAGLGLFIVRTLVEGHGGELSLQSAEGKGTSVTFTLPSVNSESIDVSPARVMKESEAGTGASRTVMSVKNVEVPVTLTIAMVTDDFLPAMTPVGSRVQALARELTRRGHTVLILTSRGSHQSFAETWEGIKVFRFISLPFFANRRALPSKSAIQKTLLDNGVHILHCHTLGAMAWQVLRAAKGTQVRTIYSVHGSPETSKPSPYAPPFKTLITGARISLLKRFNDVVCSSADQARQIQQFSDTSRVHVIPILPSLPAGEAEYLEELYLEEFISATNPKLPPQRISRTEFRLPRRHLCAACGWGVFDERAERATVPSGSQSFRGEFFTLWRCNVCRSIHCLPQVSTEALSVITPMRNIRGNPFINLGFINLDHIMNRLGVGPEARLLIWSDYTELLENFFRPRGRTRLARMEQHLAMDELASLPEADQDAVLVADALEVEEDPQTVFAFAARRLRPGGLLLLAGFNADGLGLSSAYPHVFFQPFRVHILSFQAIEQLARRYGFKTRDLKRRHYLDTWWPFANHRTINDVAFFADGSLEAGIRFRPHHVLRKFWRIPRFLALGFFGGIFPEKSSTWAVFEKVN